MSTLNGPLVRLILTIAHIFSGDMKGYVKIYLHIIPST